MYEKRIGFTCFVKIETVIELLPIKNEIAFNCNGRFRRGSSSNKFCDAIFGFRYSSFN